MWPWIVGAGGARRRGRGRWRCGWAACRDRRPPSGPRERRPAPGRRDARLTTTRCATRRHGCGDSPSPKAGTRRPENRRLAVTETETRRHGCGDSAVTGAGTRAATGWRPVGWVGLTIGTASAAAVLAGGLAATALPVLLGATVTRAARRPRGRRLRRARPGRDAAPARRTPAGPRELPDVLRGVDRATVATAGAWLVLVLLGVGFRAAEAYGRPVGALGAAELRTFAFTLTAGRGLLLTAGCAATVLVCAALRTRDPDRVPQRVVLVAALLGALAPAVTGHAGTSADHQLAVVTVALHVAAAALWVGGLGAVVVVAGPRRRLLDAVLPRFSTLAGGCIACVVVSGVLNAVLRVSSLGGAGHHRLRLARPREVGVRRRARRTGLAGPPPPGRAAAAGAAVGGHRGGVDGRDDRPRRSADADRVELVGATFLSMRNGAGCEPGHVALESSPAIRLSRRYRGEGRPGTRVPRGSQDRRHPGAHAPGSARRHREDRRRRRLPHRPAHRQRRLGRGDEPRRSPT